MQTVHWRALAGGAKLATHSVGAYSRVRKQFKVPIAELEGVQERLANIAQVCMAFG
jgi:acyl-CoA dehydrogenase